MEAGARDVRPQSLATVQPQPRAEPGLLTGAQSAPVIAWVGGAGQVFALDVSAPGASAPELQAESQAPITGLAVSSDGSRMAYATYDSQLTILPRGAGAAAQATQTFPAPAWLTSLSFSPDGDLLGGVDPPNFTVYLLETAGGRPRRTLEWVDSPTASLYFVAFSPDWSRLAWVSQTAVQIMEIETGAAGPLLNHEDHVGAAVWAPDGRRLATAAAATLGGSQSPAVLIWDGESGELLQTLPQAAAVKSLAFSPDGTQVAVLDSRGDLKIWTIGLA
jgi:WD40 repeat protein